MNIYQIINVNLRLQKAIDAANLRDVGTLKPRSTAYIHMKFYICWRKLIGYIANKHNIGTHACTWISIESSILISSSKKLEKNVQGKRPQVKEFTRHYLWWRCFECRRLVSIQLIFPSIHFFVNQFLGAAKTFGPNSTSVAA